MNKKSNVLAPQKTAIKLDITPSPMMYSTLRNSGYSNYSAITDIIDNSIDAGATEISVTLNLLEGENHPDSSILIADNGRGIAEESFREVFRIAGDGGKEFNSDLGCYGVGLKLAASSIGRCFEVLTRAEGTNSVKHIVHDIDEIVKNGFNIEVSDASEQLSNDFNKIIKNHGTTICITKLDRLSTNSKKTFQDRLIKEIAQTYKIFIDELGINFYVNGIKVESYDFMFRDLPQTQLLSSFNEEFEFDGTRVRFNAYYIGKTVTKFHKEIKRNGSNAGLYIFRNNRLVGKGLDLGIVNKHSDGWLHGFRCEVFFDGDADRIFGSTFLKIINEKEKGEINQSFRDIFAEKIKKYVSTAFFLEKKSRREDKESLTDDGEIIKSINKNTLIPRVKGEGKPRGEYDKSKDPIASQVKIKDFCAVKKEKLGARDNMFFVTYNNGKHVVHLNTDHIFYKEAYSQLDDSARSVILKLFIGFSLSKEQLGYYDDAEKDLILEEFFGESSEQVRKLFIG